MKTSSLSALKTSRYCMFCDLLCSRWKEERLLQHEEPQLGVHGNGLDRDQDRLHPEKPHLDLRVLSPAAPIQEEPLQAPNLPSPWVADPVACALFRRLEPFGRPRASRRPGCRLRHRSLLLPRNSRRRLLADAPALCVLTALVACSGCRFLDGRPAAP